MKLETLAIHAGKHIDAETGAVTQPIHMSTTFERAEDGSYPLGYSYGRGNNPTRAALERRLAALEGGAAAAAFSSGTAAISAILQTLAPGDHMIAPRDIYYGVIRTLREVFTPWGLQVTFIDMTDEAALKAALRPQTKLVWVETPSNPLMRITPIARVAEIAHAAGALCVCDNTFATPVLQNPLRHGADGVMHSTTKFMNGHTDIIGGAVIARENGEFFQKVKKVQTNVGAIPSPFDCWLLMRGIATLPLRMKAHGENAMRVASYLAAHPKVEAVHYPGLRDHPGHDIAAEQMSGFGGMASVQVKGGRDEAFRAVARLRVFTRATSLGGVESLIEHRASVEGPGSTTPENLLRMSIGLENADDLIDDLKQALE
ncbi:MAG: aminotransferase class V-fold PLP-dependent enzyme [Chloroflexi bacterium]|nr:aminotransferase class V-fold PLP-dependent enzyme [Chloroflexota bacterium]